MSYCLKGLKELINDLESLFEDEGYPYFDRIVRESHERIKKLNILMKKFQKKANSKFPDLEWM